jgi:GNAT superfamily N-acetyltransferase
MTPATALRHTPQRIAPPGGARIRPMLRTDLERIADLRKISYRSSDQRGFGLVHGIRGARWAVAETPKGRLTGMVGAVPLGETGVLCHLAVLPDHRGRGLGTALSSWAVSYLQNWGAETVRLYSTARAEGLYLSLGFEPVAHRSVFRLDAASRALVRGQEVKYEADGRRVSRLSLRDLPELCALDRRSCGANRAALILPTLRAYPGPSLVARDAFDRINGYLLSSVADDAVRVGPYAAATPAVARALLSRVLPALPLDSSVEVVVPGLSHSPAREVLQELGFHERQDRLRMEFGDPFAPAGIEQYGTTPYLAT